MIPSLYEGGGGEEVALPANTFVLLLPHTHLCTVNEERRENTVYTKGKEYGRMRLTIMRDFCRTASCKPAEDG